MIRVLSVGDEEQVQSFLSGHTETSMFLRSNLRAAGIVDRGETYQGTWVGAFEGDSLTALACHAWNGMLMLQAPTPCMAVVQLAVDTSGREISGISGPWEQLCEARDGLGLAEASVRFGGPEELFALDLDQLRLPLLLSSPQVTVRRATLTDAAVLNPWKTDYEVGLYGGPAEARVDSAEAGVRRTTEAGHLFVAEANGELVAMAAYNATLPDVVQIGSVYTPPSLRGRGFGRYAVAGCLEAAREAGVRRGILFTEIENTPALRAYAALGFERIGRYGVVIFA